ncbi:GntR family transcriptional regulator [Pseudaminobacter sp. 19-2017]|uniref:GntR family transcriptional regulator n=1 Tax=Pseudaminobacter soli (ex Zhang et al. 2022) TaxID=2831468 RepID=A0A942IAR3_9HYPH|nr:GntR family transcriptional regulator [Pseudaminobacter soli]MBS3651575.1 GntR family transcriptional regulator [Pseudaminobacter soli]
MAGLASVTRRPLQDQIYNALYKAISSGAFAPGQRFSLRSVADALGTSTMPVREAVGRLVEIGALELLENRRLRVPLLDAPRYRDLIRARLLIEASATEAGVPTISDEAIAELARMHRDMCELSEKPYTDEYSGQYLAINRNFHFTIYESAKSQTLTNIIESLWVRTGPFLHILHQRASTWRGNDIHARILEAVQRRDGPAAKLAIYEDIESAMNYVIEDEMFK